MKKSDLGFLEGFIPYILVVVFTALFWGATYFFWQQAASQIVGAPPSLALTVFALPLPFLGYWVLRHSQPDHPFNTLTYTGTQVLALTFWSIAVWLWLQAYIWYEFVADLTFILVFLFLLLPYMSMVRILGTPESGRPSGVVGWADSWLTWMGNGEPHRGTLVLLVVIFWSILFWNWPAPPVRNYPIVLTVPIWGLLTIFGLVTIRTMFFRQTQLPGQEVPAGDAKKSK